MGKLTDKMGEKLFGESRVAKKAQAELRESYSKELKETMDKVNEYHKRTMSPMESILAIIGLLVGFTIFYFLVTAFLPVGS